ncbi:enhanced serine sensitivity protein SseB C-terminal domain-containing protein [Hymenobacter coccineus]|uniref:SseB protein N-terminal domain-containing protein n=1 Tax=Hymenobacter coccineus TaxID=1908235 RepID=A0A1G1TLI7_9BACT|nr:enhanced serine sensitivity protein SseB C-terminal domain-containing protein [Hymenobacter coccineus]OGX91742.1 hypothetical protein BEN49_18630 [Hymenobacter coccineus]
MGLLDFLKNKPENKPADAPAPTPTTPGAPTPAPLAPADAAAKPAGPRYQGSNFKTPAPEAAPVSATPLPFPAPEPLPLPFEPENVLEQLLLMAATEEQARPAFYQALMQEEILMILAPEEGVGPGDVVPAEGAQIQLQVLTDGKLPIFTSPSRLADGGQDASEVSYVRIPGHAFFSMVQGQDCVLNPFSPAGKLLPKEEIEALLNGQLTGPTSPAGGDAEVLLSQPENYPTAVADAVVAWAATQPHLRTAYLAQMQLANAPETPRLLLAFESDAAGPEFMQELGPVLEGKTDAFQFVDLMLLDLESAEGVNPYFLQIEPIYQRA